MKRKISSFVALLLLPNFALAEPIGIFSLLDKVSARLTEIELPQNTPITIGDLIITMRACTQAPPSEAPEAKSFLEITQERENENLRLFSGWMFSASPSINALEHPVYDIWVLRCKNLSSQ